MWKGQEEFEVTVAVEAKPFDRVVAPLRTKLKLKRKPASPPANGQDGGSSGESKQ